MRKADEISYTYICICVTLYVNCNFLPKSVIQICSKNVKHCAVYAFKRQSLVVTYVNIYNLLHNHSRGQEIETFEFL